MINTIISKGSSQLHIPPQQNELIERENRTIVEMNRSMLQTKWIRKIYRVDEIHTKI